MNTTDLLRKLTGPLPTFGDRYTRALAAIHEVEQRIALARFLFDLDEERFGAVIADLEAQLQDWKSEVAAATRDRQEADACSVRMRGSTVSARRRGPHLRLGAAPPASQTSVRTRGPRARGAGRPKAQATRSSARSGDSGGDGLGESDEPPSRRRLCACGCGADISHRAAQARHLNDTHAAADRQRRKRLRDRARDPRPTIDDAELLRLLSKATCACNGHHILDDDDVLGQRCSKCGRQRPESPPGQKLLGQLAALREAVGP